MIDDAGGWQHDTLTEDSDLSYRAQLKGWKFVYLPGLDCPSELPVEIHGFQVQQFRWAKGLTQCAKKLLPDLLRAKIPFRVKLEAIMHLTPNISYPLMMVISALMLPVMIVRFYMGVWEMMVLDFPLIVASFWSLSAFYVIAQRELHPKTWKRSILLAADADGGRRGADSDQYARGAGSFVRSEKRLRPYAEICDRRHAAEAHGGEKIQAQERLAALFRTGLRHLFPLHVLVRDYRRSTIRRCRFCCCSSADITGPDSARSTRNIRTGSATIARHRLEFETAR